ncbi:MAG: hypothetical protein ACFFAO_11400, partial [Candidatus Hermodarchaeota archaeon]
IYFMTEQELKNKISELNVEITSKEREIVEYLERIEILEDNILQLESCIPDDSSNITKKQWKKGMVSKLEIQLEHKDREIRDLKNRMGYLRKEKIEYQHKFEQLIRENDHKVIRIEAKKEPFEVLIKELQDKINKQQLVISKLQEELQKGEVETLKKEIVELNKKLESVSFYNQAKEGELLSKGKTKKLEKKLKKSERYINLLEDKLKIYKQKIKKRKDHEKNSIIQELREKILDLEHELNRKNERIENFNKLISNYEKTNGISSINNEVDNSKNSISKLTEDLQKKLNKAKIKIESLENELERYKDQKSTIDTTAQDKIIKELRSKLDKIEAQDTNLNKINTIQKQITHSTNQDEQLILRIRELENFIEELKKEHIQQRLEISKLRKK